MSTLAPFLITWLQQYGYPALWLCVFIASIGIPLPISLVFLAAGAFSALGDFNVLLLAVIGITASVSGDSVGYLLGRKWGRKIIAWLSQYPQTDYKQKENVMPLPTLSNTNRDNQTIPDLSSDFALRKQKRFSFISAQALEKSQVYFNRRGGGAIFLSRFLFSGLGGSLNLLAGAELFPYPRYLLYDFSGEVLGVCIPLSLGYVFGASWEAVGDILSTLSFVSLASLCAVYFSWRFIKQIKQARREKKQEWKESQEEAEGKTATFGADQTYTKEIDAEIQPGLDILAKNYTKNGSEGLE